jgi:hypothetical protein
MDRFDTVVQEIIGVEREYPADAVDVHHRHQPGIVNLDPHDAVLH